MGFHWCDLELLFVPRLPRGAGRHSSMGRAGRNFYLNIDVFSHPAYSWMMEIDPKTQVSSKIFEV